MSNLIEEPPYYYEPNAISDYYNKLASKSKSTKLYDLYDYNISEQRFELLMKHKHELLDYLSEKYPEDFLI
jgi:hypothetical protein